jgi:hypothetical protein
MAGYEQGSRKRKRAIHEVMHGTPMKDIAGITSNVIQDLALAGFNIRNHTTFAEFKDMTRSYENIAQSMRDMEMDAGFTLGKLRTLWNFSPSGQSSEDFMNRKKQRNVAKDTALSTESALQPRISSPPKDTEENKEPDREPAVDALHRVPDQTTALTLGMVVKGPELSVIPDVTLNVSPPDGSTIATTQVLPTDPVPLIPAVALGPAVVASRTVKPLTLEERQLQLLGSDDLQLSKANAQKDIGSDSFGNMTEEAKLGDKFPIKRPDGEEEEEPEEEPEERKDAGVQKRKFRRTPITQGKGDGKGGGKGGKGGSGKGGEQEPQQTSKAKPKPYKQASLLANHDSNIQRSAMLRQIANERIKLQKAEGLVAMMEVTDQSFSRYNAATQGVLAPYTPIGSANYLQRGPMTTSLQYTGVAPLYNQHVPCPYLWEKMSGRFR